jgi:hypothetical protein
MTLKVAPPPPAIHWNRPHPGADADSESRPAFEYFDRLWAAVGSNFRERFVRRSIRFYTESFAGSDCHPILYLPDTPKPFAMVATPMDGYAPVLFVGAPRSARAEWVLTFTPGPIALEYSRNRSYSHISVTVSPASAAKNPRTNRSPFYTIFSRTCLIPKPYSMPENADSSSVGSANRSARHKSYCGTVEPECHQAVRRPLNRCTTSEMMATTKRRWTRPPAM